MDSAQTGDRVRALTDRREPDSVAGIFVLDYREEQERALLWVFDQGQRWLVHPDSVEVVRRAAASPQELQAAFDSLDMKDAGPIRDLADAMEREIVDIHVRRPDLTWKDLFAQLDEVIKPLLAAGWRQLDEAHQESEPGHADSVAYDFEREGQTVEVELDEDGVLLGWDVDDEYDGVDDPPDPLFAVHEPDLDARLSAMRDQGWLEPRDSAI